MVTSTTDAYLRTCPFSIFVSNLEEVTEWALVKFSGDTKLGWPLDILEGRAAIQGDLGRLEEWADRNLMKFNKDNCRALYLGGKNHQILIWNSNYSVMIQAGDWLVGEQFCWKGLGALHGASSGPWQQGRLGVLGCMSRNLASRLREVIVPHYSPLVGPNISLVSSVGLSSHPQIQDRHQ